ncbi:Uncharacterized protein BXIN_0007 [Babesia sp. Xinjiang]|uniref:Uncharacterized protein n=1 Tax=Babesia sp. Xinjiang TaxID=462227 RepID=UPI000A22C51F|nr:Uncharacterized protein BXIN_0007 [Babesia sp. Xinjiang]ORM39791.1 Uncharacterized protein BXIN_0007 [Babesia sp. Xinjiang]
MLRFTVNQLLLLVFAVCSTVAGEKALKLASLSIADIASLPKPNKSAYTEDMFWCIMGMNCLIPKTLCSAMVSRKPFLVRGKTTKALLYPFYWVDSKMVATQQSNCTAFLYYYGPVTSVNALWYNVNLDLRDRKRIEFTEKAKSRSRHLQVIPMPKHVGDYGDEIVTLMYSQWKFGGEQLVTIGDVYLLKAPSKIIFEVDINGELRVLLKDLARGPNIILGCNFFKANNVNKYNLLLPTVSCGKDRMAVSQVQDIAKTAKIGIFKLYIYIKPYSSDDYGNLIGVVSMIKQDLIGPVKVAVTPSEIIVRIWGIDTMFLKLHMAVLSATSITGSGSLCGSDSAQWYEVGFPVKVPSPSGERVIAIHLPLRLAGERVLICGTLDREIEDIKRYTMPFALTVLQNDSPAVGYPSIINVDALGRASITLDRLIHPLSEIRLTPADDDIMLSIHGHSTSAQLTKIFKRVTSETKKTMDKLGDVSLDPSSIQRLVAHKDFRTLQPSYLTYTPSFSYQLGTRRFWSTSMKFFPKLLFGIDKLYKISVCDRWQHPHCLSDSDFDKDIGYVVPNRFILSKFAVEWRDNHVILTLTTAPFCPFVPFLIAVKIPSDTIVDYDRVCSSPSYSVAYVIGNRRTRDKATLNDMYNGRVINDYELQYKFSGLEEGNVYCICYNFQGSKDFTYSVNSEESIVKQPTPLVGSTFKFLTILNPFRLSKNQHTFFRPQENNMGPVFTTTGFVKQLRFKGIYMSEDLSYNCSNLYNEAKSQPTFFVTNSASQATKEMPFELKLESKFPSTTPKPLPAGFWLTMDEKSWVFNNSTLMYRGKVNAPKALYKACVCYDDGCTATGTMTYSQEHSFNVTQFVDVSLLSRVTVGSYVCVYGKDDLHCFNTISHLKAANPSSIKLGDPKGSIRDVVFNEERCMIVVKEGKLVKYDEDLKLSRVIRTAQELRRVYSFPNVAFFLSLEGDFYFDFRIDPLGFTDSADEKLSREHAERTLALLRKTLPTASETDDGEVHDIPSFFSAGPYPDISKATEAIMEDDNKLLDLSTYSKISLPGIKGRILALDILSSEAIGLYHLFYIDESLSLHYTIANLLDYGGKIIMNTSLVSSLALTDHMDIYENRNLIVKGTPRSFGDTPQLFVLVHSYGCSNLSIFEVLADKLNFYGHMKTTAKMVDFALDRNYLLGLTAGISRIGEISQSVIEIPLNRLLTVSLRYPTIPRLLHVKEDYSFEPESNGNRSGRYYTRQKPELEQYGMTLDPLTGRIYGRPKKRGKLSVSIRVLGDFYTSYAKIDFDFICEIGSLYNEAAKQCVKCAKGTFWSASGDKFSCLKCEDYLKNSSTIDTGARSVSDCLCAPGSYLKDFECHPCPPGTTSEGYGSENCPLVGVTETIADEVKKNAEVDMSCKVGTYLKGDACVACTVGFYCLGGALEPFRCSYGMTTEKAGAKSSSDCLCNAGYEWTDGRCVPCSRTSYKEEIGNTSCTSCPSVANSKGMVYTPFYGATSLRQCMHCTDGYYYDANRLSCVPCPVDSFCPGKGSIPLFCPSNTMTKGTKAAGKNDCFCLKGHGYAPTTRYILSLDNPCVQCPINTFQHMNGTTMPCMPCPTNTYTALPGATSLAECLPGPGFYSERGDAIKNTVSRMESFEGSTLDKSTVTCASKVTFDDSFAITILSRSLSSCVDSCKNNIYCRFVSYGDAYDEVVHTDAMLGGDSSYISYRPCKLIMAYERFRVPKLGASMEPLDLKKHRHQVLCEVSRPKLFLDYSSLTIKRCPMNHYCPGGEKFTKFPCPENSTTITDGASHSGHCLCLPGFELSSSTGLSKCVPCKEGFYKDSTSNAPCSACPEMMTTINTGAVSASQCVCSVGYFASPVTAMTPVTQSPALITSFLRLSGTARMYSRKSVLTKFLKDNFNILGDTNSSKLLNSIKCHTCPDGYACPGRWLPNNTFSIHNPPVSCPDGSAVPRFSESANSVAKCICKPGYGAGKAFGGDVFLSCQKCAPGTFSETYGTSTCPGRCNDYAITFPGASSFKDCFCLPGRFMTLQLIDGEEKFVCKKCSEGTVCPGGFTYRHLSARLSDNPQVAIFSHTTQYPRIGYMAIFKRHVATAGKSIKWMPNDHSTYIVEPPTPAQYGLYDNIPDIHPCVYSNRCNTFGEGGCLEGSNGYLCGKCTSGYDVRHFQSDCFQCRRPFYEFLNLVAPRFILLMLVFIVSELNDRASRGGDFSIVVLFKIWYMFSLSLVPLGMQQLNTSSSLVRFYTLYHNYFYKPINLFMHTERLGCWKGSIIWISSLLRWLGLPLPELNSPDDLDYIYLWYMQRFLGLAKPFTDVILLCILYYLCSVLYRSEKYIFKRATSTPALGQRLMALSKMVKTDSQKGNDEDAAVSDMCLESLDVVEGSDPVGVVYMKRRRTGDVFLIQQILLLLAFHLPATVINSLSMLWCGSVRYKDGGLVNVLMHLPDQVCDPNDRLFRIGRAVGIINLSLWLLMLLSMFYMLSTSNYGYRSWNTLFMSGCDSNCRWWDAVHFSRQFLLACLVVCHYSIKNKGDTEYVRATCYFILHFVYVTLHLTFSPYDKRNNDCFNSLETLTLFSNLCMSIFIQGSYLYDFSDLGGFPIVVSLLVHIKIIWTIVLEYWDIQFVNMKNSGKNEFVNMIIDLLPFGFEHRTALVYYDYKNDNLVMESAKSQELSRSFFDVISRPLLKSAGFIGLASRGPESPSAWSYTLQNREFLISCIRDTIERRSMLKQDVSLSDTWFYFITRYVFWYCHCLHIDIHDENLSENELFHKVVYYHFFPQENMDELSLSNFLTRFPLRRLSSHGSVHHNGKRCDGKCAIFSGSKKKRKVDEVAESLLVECLFDTVYDLGPVTLVEFYSGLLSLNQLHNSVVFRMFEAFRIHSLFLKDEKEFHLLREAVSLNDSISALKQDIADKGESGAEALQRYQLTSEIEELESGIDKLKDTIKHEHQVIMAGRAAAAVALNLHLGVDNIVAADLSHEDILSAISNSAGGSSDPSGRRKGVSAPVYNVLLFLFSICASESAGKLPRTTCAVPGFGDCDLSRLTSSQTKKDFFVIETDDIRSPAHCTGSSVPVVDSIYIPKRYVLRGYLCYNDGVVNKAVAIIDYKGIRLGTVEAHISYGRSWKLTADVSVPFKEDKPFNDTHYHIAFKHKDCSSGSGILVTPQKKTQKSKTLLYGVTYHGPESVKEYTMGTVLCVCPLSSKCTTVADYKQYLSHPEIEGPYINGRMFVDCSFGARCFINIDGKFNNTQKKFAVSPSKSFAKYTMLDDKGKNYEFKISKDTVSYSKSIELTLEWFPSDNQHPRIVDIGTLWLHNYYEGDLYVLPFGAQQLFLPLSGSKFEMATFSIIEFTQLISDSDSVDVGNIWTNIETIERVQDHFLISHTFESGKKYGLSVSWQGSSSDSSEYPDSTSRSALLGHVIPKGVTEYVNRLVTEDNSVCIQMPTLNMSALSRTEPIILARSCGWESVEFPYMTLDGLVSRVRLESAEKKASFKWFNSGIGYEVVAGDNLKLCWCGVSLGFDSECSDSGYGVEVGNVYVTPKVGVPIKCYLGSFCATYAVSSDDATKFYLSPTCELTNALKFENGSLFFAASRIDIHNMVHLTGSIGTSADVGKYKLCFRSETSESSTPDILPLFQQEFYVERLELLEPRYYLDLFGTVELNLKGNNKIYQYLLVSESCNGTGPVPEEALYTDKSFYASPTIYGSLLKVCWCKPHGDILCKRREDFRLEVGEIFLSGFRDTAGLYCDVKSSCTIRLEFWSYYSNDERNIKLPSANSTLKIQKEECNATNVVSDVLNYSGKSESVVMDHEGLTYTLKHDLFYSGTLQHDTPGTYNLCYLDVNIQEPVKITDIYIRASVSSATAIGIFLGRPFNIVLRGPYTSDMSGFLTTDPNCNIEIGNDNYDLSMPESPTITTDHMGSIIMIWPYVSILRSAKGREMAKKGRRGETVRYYFCLSGAHRNHATGRSYMLFVTPLLTKSFSDGARGFSDLQRQILPPGLAYILVVTLLEEPTSLESCESNSWRRDLTRVALSVYEPTYEFFGNHFPTLVYSKNTYICSCMGDGGLVLGDFRTSVYIPYDMTPPSFQILPYDRRPLNMFVVGGYVSYFDRIRLFLGVGRCGDMGAHSLYRAAPPALTPRQSIARQQSLRPTKSSNLPEALRAFGIYKKDDFIWESQGLPTVEAPSNSHILYHICFCPSTARHSCKNMMDYTEWLGVVATTLPKSDGDVHMMRLTVFPSDIDHRLPECVTKVSVQHSVSYYNVIDHRERLSDFISDYLRRHHSTHEGFFLEICEVTRDKDFEGLFRHHRVFGSLHSGYFPLQRPYITSGTANNLIVYGHKMKPAFIDGLVVIKASSTCDNIKDSTRIAYATTYKRFTEDFVIFCDIKVPEAGLYKFCLSVNPASLPSALDTTLFSIDYKDVPPKSQSERAGAVSKPKEPDRTSKPQGLSLVTVSKSGHAKRADTSARRKASDFNLSKKQSGSSQWDLGGILNVVDYQVFCLPDLLILPFRSSDNIPFKTRVRGSGLFCRSEWYRNFSVLCILAMQRMAIVSDCENHLWLAQLPEIDVLSRPNVKPQRLTSLEWMLDPEPLWKGCKAVDSKKIYFLGSIYFVSMALPMQDNGGKLLYAFKHGLYNPMDFTTMRQYILISDEYTRSLTIYREIHQGKRIVWQTHSLVYKCYYNGLYFVDRGGDIGDLFALDALTNTVTRYKFNFEKLALAHDYTFHGLPSAESDTATPMTNPCCIDGYVETSDSDHVEILLVGESITGRILVLIVVPSKIELYKVIYTNVILSSVNVIENGLLALSSWGISQGNMINCVYVRTINSYVELSFYYNLLPKYTIGSNIELIPVLVGDRFEFFIEGIVETDAGPSTLDSLGLKLDNNTGVITGRLRVSGRYKLHIIGGNFLKSETHVVDILGLCPPSHEFNLDTQKCDLCPVGFYRDDEEVDKCLKCSDALNNSTTLTVGARTIADCVCDKQFYPKDDKCVPCETGTFKGEIGNIPCSGTCAPNRRSVLNNSGPKPVYDCLCVEKYFDPAIAVKRWSTLPKAVLDSVGVIFDEDTNEPTNLETFKAPSNACIPCPVGYYCPGNHTLPQSCGFGSTTTDVANADPSTCVCDQGYGYSARFGCVACSGFGYKDVVGNTDCRSCHDNLGVPITLPLLPNIGPIRIISKEEWFNELEDYARKAPQLHSSLTNLLDSATLFADTNHARTQDRCKYCTAGSYFDINTRSCVGCPADRFCPGGDYQPSNCGVNGITKTTNRTSSMDCYCERGYGNLFEGRHPTTGTIWCQHCPAGYFQHLNLIDYGCLPCPDHSSTINHGATSLLQCSADPGSYLSITKIHRDSGIVTDLLEELGDDFENRLGADREHSWMSCFFTPRSSIKSAHRETVLRDTSDACEVSCVDNVYCKGYVFEDTIRFVDYESNPHNANEFVLFNGLRFLKESYGVCTLYFFSLSFLQISKGSLHDVSSDDVVSICKVYDPQYEYEFVTKPCPLGYYCQGGTGYTRCPEHSTTMVEGASDVNHCLCAAGYEISTSQNSVCVPCSLGSYKQEIGNIGCRRCPDKFRTFKTGAKLITDCACSPGHYARLIRGPEVLTYEAIYKRMKDHTVLKSSDDELMNFYQELWRTEELRNASRSGSANPYRIGLPRDMVDFRSHIDSFIFLSKALLLLPQNGPAAVITDDDYIIACERCKPYHYCPGGWASSSPERMIHNIPYRCPDGSNVPTEATNATSVSQCLCIPGYRLNTDAPMSASVSVPKVPAPKQAPESNSESKDTSTISLFNPMATAEGIDQSATDSQETIKPSLSALLSGSSSHSSVTARDWLALHFRTHCVKCEAGMYKEGQENSSCSGRCMQYATTYGGAVSPKQCFCNYGRYMTLDDTLGSMQLRCARCLEGAICPGGLSTAVIDMLRNDRTYTKIQLKDHRRPMARFGYFAAFKDQGVALWSPLSQSPSSFRHVSTDMLDFHACPMEYLCTSCDSTPCEKGSTGYLCMKCLKGYDRPFFRSKCIECGGLWSAVRAYVSRKALLWVIASSILFLLHKRLFYQFVIMKIWLEFCFSMVPYGIFPLNSESSLKRFASQYNAVFGHQQRLFIYARVSCLIEQYARYDLTNAQKWYIQRYLSLFQPILDGSLLYVILLLLRLVWHVLRRLRRHIPRRYSFVASPSGTLDNQGSNVNALTGSDMDALTDSSHDNGRSIFEEMRSLRRWQWTSPCRCLMVMYYISFQFICQELLQTLWCVPVQYKSEPAISVLLYMPTVICNTDDRLFSVAQIVSCTVLVVLILFSIGFVFFSVRRRGSVRLFSSGRQRHTLAWDAVLFVRRFLVAVVVIFQPYTLSPGSSEKLRMIGSVLVTTLLLIAHLSVLPYQVRDDNLFNRLELFAMLLNCFTGFLILGSFSYDFNYTGLFPIVASLLYSCLLLWYMLVECGFISDLRPTLRRRLGTLPNFWSFCRKLLLWHCHSQITFDYNTCNVVIERPFTGHASPRKRPLHGERNTHVTLAGRRAFCLCIQQSVSRYVVEHGCFSVPLDWEEFLVRYSFAYKCLNAHMRGGNVVSTEFYIENLYSGDLFDAGPINPWQMSIATLNVPISSLASCYKLFENTKLGVLYDLKCRYSELCVEATEELSGRTSDVDDVISQEHELARLRRVKEHLSIAVAAQLRNAKDGQRATRAVQAMENTVSDLVETDLTNEEILEKIAEYQRKYPSSTRHID